MTGIIDMAWISEPAAEALVPLVASDASRRFLVHGEDSPIYVTPSGIAYVLTRAQADELYEPLLNLAANEFRARASTGAAANFDISDFGLDLVAANDAAALAVVLDFPDLSGFTISDDTTLASDSSTELPTVHAAKTYSDTLVAAALTGVWKFRPGSYDASTNLYPAAGTGSGPAGAIMQGDAYFIGVGGTLGGKVVAPGDFIFALVDTPAQTAGNWGQIETNLGYVPLNAASLFSDLVGSLATARTNIGLGTGDSPTFTGVTATSRADIGTAVTGTARALNVGGAVLIERSNASPHAVLLRTGGTGPYEWRYNIGSTGTFGFRNEGNSQEALQIEYSAPNACVFMAATGFVGITTTTPDRKLHAEQSDAVTNAVAYVERLTHVSTGTVVAGFGVGVEYELENASGTNRIAATQEYAWSDATNASEDCAWKLRLIRAGALTDALTVDSLGALTVAGTTAATSTTTGSGIFGGGIGVAGDAWIGGKAALKTSDALVTAHSTMGATETFDASASDIHSGTLDAACTFTLSNPSASGRQTTLVLWIYQNGTGGFAITWPASVKADPASPTVITTANSLTIYTLTTIDGGTTWIRSVVATGIV